MLLVRSFPSFETDLTPYQKIACAVIRQAILDAQYRMRQLNRGGVPTRCTLGAWLRHEESLRIWCSVAGLDPELVLTKLDRVVSDNASAAASNS